VSNAVVNIFYYGLIVVFVVFISYIGFKADFEIKKAAVKEAMQEMNRENK
jgi:hypothetical protein